MPLNESILQFGRRLKHLFSRRAVLDRDLEEEMQLHRELRSRELQDQGLGSQEARYAAQRRFGNTLKLREQIHDSWSWNWMDKLARDVRYGIRRLRRQPGFTVLASLTLALAIGANTAIFTLIQQVMLNPLPVAHARELYSLGDDKFGCCGGGFMEDFSVYSYPLYLYLRDHTPEFSDLAGFMADSVSLGVRREGDGSPAQAFRGEYVSGNYFSVLGVDAAAGRMLGAADDQQNASPAVVMSYRAWRDKFGSDGGLIGQHLIIKGVPVTLVGVTAPDFFGDTLTSDPPDFWMPLALERTLNPGQASLLDHWNEYWLYAIGRLRPGADPRAVQAHVTAELQQWLRENYVADRFTNDPYLASRYTRDIPKQHIVVIPASGGVASTRDNNRDALRLLMVISALVLLIACANIANLLLARSMVSRLQIGVRLALGASRADIMRQTISEGVLLALLGGAAGVWISGISTRAIVSLAFRGAHFVPIRTTPSTPVLGFAFLVSLLTGVLCSSVPAWIASRTHPAEPIRGGGRSRQDRSALPQKSMIVIQAAVSFALLVGAGLLTSSLRHLETQPFGIDTQGRLVAWIDLPRNQYPPGGLPKLYQELRQQLAKIPGVVTSSFSNSAPMAGGTLAEPISIQGKPPVPKLEHGQWPSENRVSAHYFQTVGTRLLRGRLLDEHDTSDSQHVAVIDDAFARFFFPHEDPIGKYFGIQTEQHDHDYQIVGIVEDAQYVDPKIGHYPTFFLPLLQTEKYEDSAEEMEQVDSRYANAIELQVTGRPEDFIKPLDDTLAAIDPNLTVIRAISLKDQVGRNFDQERLIARLTSLYGLLALVLASVGLYGIAAYSVARRTNEIGIRMALGADRKSVVRLMVRSALTPVTFGLAIGIPLALGGGRLIAAQLFGVKGYDPLIFLAALVVLVLSATIASIIPARRASRIDPMQALRSE